jgi:tetraprenyl-beta-curcumene synthase
VVAQSRHRVALGSAFASAASTYWLDVFPNASREVGRWRAHAKLIPDPMLRRLALSTHEGERGNLEGAAAFAILVPRAHRSAVVRAAISFQAAYDYIDTLAEQPCVDPVANGHRLHLALLTALDPDRGHTDYYEYSSSSHDCQYIRSMIDTCRQACAALPSYDAVASAALQAAKRMATYQSLAHGRPGADHQTLARWSRGLTPPGSGLRWWETAASAASSLGVFALIAAAAKPTLNNAEVSAMETAYFPWIGALHLLLDSLVDRAADEEAGHHSLVEHYASTEETASRLGAIASRALQATETVPQGIQHAMILAAMTSFYLSAPGIAAQGTPLIAQRVLEAMGALANPAMAVLRARRIAGDMLALPGGWIRRLAVLR